MTLHLISQRHNPWIYNFSAAFCMYQQPWTPWTLLVAWKTLNQFISPLKSAGSNVNYITRIVVDGIKPRKSPVWTLTCISQSDLSRPFVCPLQEEQMTLCMEPELTTLTPPTQQGDASGGSSPGQPPAEPITERKASDVTSGFVQTLEERDEEGPSASMATNWVPGCQETPYYKLTGGVSEEWA